MSGRERSVEELLIRMGEFGRHVSTTLAEVVGDASLVGNDSVMLLCKLDLEGPMRLRQIVDLTGLSSGGATKLVDRMEGAGLVKRQHGAVSDDGRGVLVDLTAHGRRAVRDMVAVFDRRLPDAQLLVKEINKIVLET